MTEPGQIDRVDQEDWPAPSAEAKVRFSVTKICETSGSVTGPEKLVENVARSGSLAISGLGIGAILWVGFHYDHAIISFVAAVIFYAGVVLGFRGGPKGGQPGRG